MSHALFIKENENDPAKLADTVTEAVKNIQKRLAVQLTEKNVFQNGTKKIF